MAGRWRFWCGKRAAEFCARPILQGHLDGRLFGGRRGWKMNRSTQGRALHTQGRETILERVYRSCGTEIRHIAKCFSDIVATHMRFHRRGRSACYPWRVVVGITRGCVLFFPKRLFFRSLKERSGVLGHHNKVRLEHRGSWRESRLFQRFLHALGALRLVGVPSLPCHAPGMAWRRGSPHPASTCAIRTCWRV